MQYTQAQHEAIEAIDRNLQIIACAGSGKTQVISARIVHILEHGIPPGSIIAFTFTEKAAGELKDRIDRLARKALGSNQGLGDMFVGTIHGFCLNLLQSPPLYRYLKYNVLDDIQQRLFIDRYSVQSGLTTTPLLAGGTLRRWQESGLYQTVIGIYREGEIDEMLVPPEVRGAIEQYTALLHQHRYLDYTMIMAEAVQELETNQLLRDQLAGQVQYVVVDEYQDVNPLQERLVRQLHELGANVCVVGDDDQTIYQWRGSDVENIITFADRYPDVKQVQLVENFRSSEGVIDAARYVIELNDHRLAKRMESVNAQSFEYGDLLACSFEDPQTEAEWIVEQIRALHGTEYLDRADAEPRGLAYSDFAVLLRSVKRDAGPIVEALSEANIPFVVTGMGGLFDTPEVNAMRNAFYCMAEYANDNQPLLSYDDVGTSLRAADLGLSEADISRGLELLKARKELLAANRTDVLLFLQRFYLDFLEALHIREERNSGTGGRTGEIVFYNLGKLSQVITDYETVNLQSDPQSLFSGFAGFLHYQAPDYYPEGWEEGGLGHVEAVQILTVHRAKGMQWPVVFVPCLRNNRFPSTAAGFRQWFHVLPEAAVRNADRYKGSLDDERRLFYVAITRAERFLFCSYSRVPGNKRYNRVSPFLTEFTASSYVLATLPPVPPQRLRRQPKPRRPETTLALSFSQLKYFFECPYSFKLRFQYGFDAPIDRAIGYGRSLHNALAEIHHESFRGRIPSVEQVPTLVTEHLYLPYASEEVRENARAAAEESLKRYLRLHGRTLSKLEHVEKTVELKLADGIVVNGRIDLIRRTDTGQTSVVDFKSSRRAQAEDITRRQLQVYTVGYQQLTGQPADLIEVHNLDAGGVHRELVDQRLIDETVSQIGAAGRSLRDNHLSRLKMWCDTCDVCDFAGVCRSRNGARK
jgi:DNA helicase II / ATP-dependent DNA helicase PcrA